MKFCDAHWSALRKAIDDRGLSHLVAKTPDAVIATMLGELGQSAALQHAANHGEAPFDPLMSAHWGIFSNALEQGGLYLLSTKPDGSHYCPLCELQEHGGDVDQWLNGAADESFRLARKRNLVPEPS